MSNQTGQAGAHAPCSELLDLVVFLARYVTDINKLRWKWNNMTPEECKDAIIMQWPTIQGMRNQDNIAKIGALTYKSENVARAVKAILESNTQAHRPAESGTTRKEPENVNEA